MRVLLVILLGCSLAEGRKVSICDLRDELMPAIGSIMDKTGKAKKNVEDKVAQIVCYVNASSHCETSAVNPSPAPPSASSADEDQLYGLFQLSRDLCCENNVTKSKNICGIDCDKLMDDEIHDDIECLMKIFKRIVLEGTRMEEKLKTMIMSIFRKCGGQEAATYFADCK